MLRYKELAAAAKAKKLAMAKAKKLAGEIIIIRLNVLFLVLK